MALKREKRFFDYKDRIGVSRGGDFDTMQSYSAREAQQFENLMREQSNIAYKEAVERGEERGLLEANKANVVYEDVPITSETGETLNIKLPKKFTPPVGLSGKTALKKFKEQTHKRYITEISNSTSSIIESLYSTYADTGIDQQTFNDMVIQQLEPVYNSLDAETRNLIKLKDQTDIIQKSNYIQREYISKQRRTNSEQSKMEMQNIEKNFIRKIVGKEKHDSYAEFKQQITKQVELKITTPLEAKILLENYKDKVESITKLDTLTNKMFPSLGTENLSAEDSVKLDEYGKFLEDNTQIEFTYNGVTITKKDIESNAGKNYDNNVSGYKKTIKIHQTNASGMVKKATNQRIINSSIESYNEQSASGQDPKYVFGQKSGKDRRKLASENERQLYNNWMSKQASNGVKFDDIEKNAEIKAEWTIHKLKHGLINEETYNTYVDKINSSKPDDVLDMYQGRIIEFFFQQKDNYKHTNEFNKKINDLYSNLLGATAGTQYTIVEQYLNPDKKVDKASIVELLGMQTNTDFQKPKQVNDIINKAISEIAGARYTDDVMFSTVAVNRVMSNVYNGLDSQGLKLSEQYIKDLTKRELTSLDNTAEWGYSRFSIPVSQTVVSSDTNYFDDSQETFAKYPPEKNYQENFATIQQSKYTYKRMTDKYKAFLNRPQNDNIKKMFGKMDFGSYQNPNLRLRGRLKDNNEVEYIMVYYKDGIQYTLEDENNRVLTFDSNDFEQNILEPDTNEWRI